MRSIAGSWKRIFRRAAETKWPRRLLYRLLVQLERLLGFFDEFLKARLAAQRVPIRRQFQMSITEKARIAKERAQLLSGEVFFGTPS